MAARYPGAMRPETIAHRALGAAVILALAALWIGQYREPRCIPRAELLEWARTEGADPQRAAAWAEGIWRLAEIEANGAPAEAAERARVVLIERLKAGAPAEELGASAAERIIRRRRLVGRRLESHLERSHRR